jgi:hypothetical protein
VWIKWAVECLEVVQEVEEEETTEGKLLSNVAISEGRIADDESLTWETEVMEANEGSVEETGPEETDIDCFLKDLWAVFILY